MIKICPINNNSDISEFQTYIKTGFNAVRFNFSHVKHEIADIYYDYIKANHPDIKIIQDLQGHKLRVGKLDDTINIQPYEQFLFVPNDYRTKTSVKQVPLLFEQYELLANTTKFIIESNRRINVISILKKIEDNEHTLFLCMSSNELIFRTEKGVNAIGLNRTQLKLSKKDKTDILWGIKHKADVIVYSFVSNKKQILELKQFIKQHDKDYNPKIWAKIESQEGINNIKEILSVCDGIMIGRGDMQREISPILIPQIQDNIIKLCTKQNKDCIIATNVFLNYQNKKTFDVSDLTAMYYLIEKGATGFMLENEIQIYKNKNKISQAFNETIITFEKQLPFKEPNN